MTEHWKTPSCYCFFPPFWSKRLVWFDHQSLPACLQLSSTAVAWCSTSRNITATPAKPLKPLLLPPSGTSTLPHWPSLGQNNHKFNNKVFSLFELLKVGILLASWHRRRWTNTCKRRVPKIPGGHLSRSQVRWWCAFGAKKFGSALTAFYAAVRDPSVCVLNIRHAIL